MNGYEYYLKRLDKDEIPQKFIEVSLYDVLDNNGLSKVIGKLHKLKRDKNVKVDTPYKKPDFFHKYDYINRTIFGKSIGGVGEITFIKDPWLSSIEINYIHLNNSEIILEYKFTFKKVISSYRQIHQFVIDNISVTRKNSIFTVYTDTRFFERARLIEYVELEIRLFEDILQAFITDWLYSKYGEKYTLPIEYKYLTVLSNKNLRIKLRNSVANQCYEKDGVHIVLSDWPERMTVSIFGHGKYFPETSIRSFLMDCSIEMYYKLFYKIEAQELEHHMRKYLNSGKRFIKSKDIKWFICKIRAIDEEKPKIAHVLSGTEKPFHSKITGWQRYSQYGESGSDGMITFPYYSDHFQSLYNRNLDYLKSIASVQNNYVVLWITVATLLATLIGILISVFKP